MILILCLDDQMGMAFNKRRQSRDREVTEKIKQFASTAKFWTDGYSAKLLGKPCCVAEDCLKQAGTEEYCFVETQDPALYEGRVEKIIAFRWNRKYPADLRFEIKPDTWHCTSTTEFKGYSHENITMEVYER